MKSLSQTYEIKATPEAIWSALTDPEQIEAWGAGPATMSENIGKFSIWGGDIYGENTKVVKNKVLVQNWLAGAWDEPSVVEIILDEHGKGTTVTLNHSNIPDEEFDSIESGWQNFYFSPLKSLVESENG